MSASDASQATLHTQRLALAPIAVDDVDALWPYVSDPDLPRMMTWDHHTDKAQTRAFTERMVAARAEGTGFTWTIRERAAEDRRGPVLGVVGLYGVERTQHAWRVDRAELGYWIGAAHRNRGFTTEAARAVLRFGFETVALHKIVAACFTENAASLRVLEQLGFRLVGMHRAHLHRFDRWWDDKTFELLADDWRRTA